MGPGTIPPGGRAWHSHPDTSSLGFLCCQLSLCLLVTFGVTPFLSLRFRLVSTVQATMATVSGITVVLSCKNVVHDR